MKTAVVPRNDMNISVFQATIDKNALLKRFRSRISKQETKDLLGGKINGDPSILVYRKKLHFTGNCT